MNEAAIEAALIEKFELHGPYIQWTRTVDGRTVTRYLSEEQLARYQPCFDNARRLKEIVAKLEIASLHAVEQSDSRATRRTAASLTATPKRRSTGRSSA